MTWEARRQLSDVMCGFGFPEELMIPQDLANDHSDPRMDVAITLLSSLNPNFATTQTAANLSLMVSSLLKTLKIFSPKKKTKIFFRKIGIDAGAVLINHIRTKALCSQNPCSFLVRKSDPAITARQTTCISPAQLIMTASKVALVDGKVIVDDWIPLADYEAKEAANLCLLRAEMDGLLITAVTAPESVGQLSEEDELLVKTITR